MTNSAQERIAAATDLMNPAYRARMGYKHLDVFVLVSVYKDGWTVNVDGKRIVDNLPSLSDALDALEAHAHAVATAEDALARTLGIAS
jgi:hypothetical protein